jgi:hypothetical protein
MRLKIQEQNELNFVSRIIQSRWSGLEIIPEAKRREIETQFKIKMFSVKT